MFHESWRDVAGYEGLYQVSDLGRVRSVARVDSAGRQRKGRVLRAAQNFRYEFVGLSKDGKTEVTRVHVLVAETFIGPRPEGAVINHKNGNKGDNRPINLEYITPAENMAHARENALFGTLSKTQVQAIRYIYQHNRRFPVELLASKFGVPDRVIKGVIAARTYTEVPNIDGIPVVPLDDTMSVEAVLALRGAGLAAHEISLALDVEYSTPFQTLNRAGIWPSRNGHGEES